MRTQSRWSSRSGGWRHTRPSSSRTAPTARSCGWRRTNGCTTTSPSTRWGEAYGRGEGTTLNETVAHIAEREIARVARELHPLELEPAIDGRAPPREHSLPDFRGEMRQLRLDVDELLAQGRVAEAEALMEERRQHMALHGIIIRKTQPGVFRLLRVVREPAPVVGPDRPEDGARVGGDAQPAPLPVAGAGDPERGGAGRGAEAAGSGPGDGDRGVGLRRGRGLAGQRRPVSDSADAGQASRGNLAPPS